jgi:Zn-finger nucleic acid-binding protein
VAYRDELEKCPRCSADLVDAGSVRGCAACGGQWVPAQVLQDMAVNMQIVAKPIRLRWQRDAKPKQVLRCPTCGEPMETWKLYEVPIDRCATHGLWFDRDELMTVLLACCQFES